MSLCFRYCGTRSQEPYPYTNLSPSPLKFSPPKIPTYKISLSTSISEHGSIEQSVQFSHCTYSMNQFKYPWISIQTFQLKHYTSDSTIVVLYIQNSSVNDPSNEVRSSLLSNHQRNRHTFLFSHNEYNDLGTTIGFLIDLSTQTGKDVISYDYVGYGQSKGNLTETSFQSDIDRVIDFSLNTLQLSLHSITLIGEGIGCIPCVHASTTKTFSTVRGVILISPQLNREAIRTIGTIETNVFLIHGMNDQIVPQMCSADLGKHIKLFWSWYPSKGEHFTIITLYRRKFYKKLKLFIDILQGDRKMLDESSSLVEMEHFNPPSSNAKTAKKAKQVTTISNYIKTEANSNDNKNVNDKAPSVRMFVMEDSTPAPSMKFSEKNCISINQKSGLKKEGDYSDDEDHIFELTPESMNL